MIDFEKIEELTFIIFVLDQIVILDTGLVIDRHNFGEFITSTNDA